MKFCRTYEKSSCTELMNWICMFVCVCVWLCVCVCVCVYVYVEIDFYFSLDFRGLVIVSQSEFELDKLAPRSLKFYQLDFIFLALILSPILILCYDHQRPTLQGGCTTFEVESRLFDLPTSGCATTNL